MTEQTQHNCLGETQDLQAAVEAARLEEREACAKLMELTNAQLLLMAGEMTAQELLTVQAVLKSRARAIRNPALR